MDRSCDVNSNDMKLYVVGVEPVVIHALREQGYEVVPYTDLPETGPQTGTWIITSEIVPLSELAGLKRRLPEANLVYWYVKNGIAGWQSVQALCKQLNVYFLRPGIGISALLDYMKVWLQQPAATSSNVVGVFGTIPGIGCTRVAATIAQTIAQTIARQGKKVILLGLNLFQPGWEGETAVSLDTWRQRLIGRMLQSEDLDQLIRTHGFSYLPGNFDLLSAMDYGEEDIAHLLQVVSQNADVVVADCGAIPESAAWFCGMQSASFRIVVAHPQQTRSLKAVVHLADTLEIPAEHLFLCGNRIRSEDVPLHQLAAETRAQPWVSFPDKGWFSDFTMPLGRREQESLDGALGPVLEALGMEPKGKKKGWL